MTKAELYPDRLPKVHTRAGEGEGLPGGRLDLWKEGGLHHLLFAGPPESNPSGCLHLVCGKISPGYHIERLPSTGLKCEIDPKYGKMIVTPTPFLSAPRETWVPGGVLNFQTSTGCSRSEKSNPLLPRRVEEVKPGRPRENPHKECWI